ncbi:MAG: thrombospondin type 3 repeat-containing protein [Patescibacteria group bacterium]
MEGIKNDPEKEHRIKIGVTILVVLCVVAVLGIIWQYPKYLRAPFARYGQDIGLWKSQLEQEAEKITAMKEADTDNDGLSDYDETYLYGTSPYLADSDSDGFSDKEEIASGNDPNCAAGKICPKLTEEGAARTEPTVTPPAEEELGGLLAGTATADEVRDALRQAGVDDATLASLDDKTLLELYNETLKEAGGGMVSGGTNTNSLLPTNVNASEMTPDQLRELLRQAGVDEATLQSVDDATLMKIFQETVNK